MGFVQNELKWDETHVQLAVLTPNCIKTDIKSCSAKKTNEPDLRMLNRRLEINGIGRSRPHLLIEMFGSDLRQRCQMFPNLEVQNTSPSGIMVTCS